MPLQRSLHRASRISGHHYGHHYGCLAQHDTIWEYDDAKHRTGKWWSESYRPSTVRRFEAEEYE